MLLGASWLRQPERKGYNCLVGMRAATELTQRQRLYLRANWQHHLKLHEVSKLRYPRIYGTIRAGHASTRDNLSWIYENDRMCLNRIRDAENIFCVENDQNYREASSQASETESKQNIYQVDLPYIERRVVDATGNNGRPWQEARSIHMHPPYGTDKRVPEAYGYHSSSK